MTAFSPLFLTCCWNRPAITRIFLEGAKRLNVPVLAAVSDTETLLLFDDYPNAHCITVDNSPLGRKWNFIAQVALGLPNWTHLIITGDDNLYSKEFIDRIRETYIADGTTKGRLLSPDYMGLESIYFIEPRTGRASVLRYPNDEKRESEMQKYIARRDASAQVSSTEVLSHKFIHHDVSIGTGKVLSRDIVEVLDGEICDPSAERSLDISFDAKLMSKGEFPKILDKIWTEADDECPKCMGLAGQKSQCDCVEETPTTLALDIKHVNMWSFDNFSTAVKCDYEEVLNLIGVGEVERELLNQLK